MRSDLQMGTSFLFGGDGSVLKLDCGDGCTTLGIYEKLLCTYR